MGARIEITHWSYRYPLKEDWAVKDVNLNVAAGEKILLTGRSGWGKSTLLQAIAGIVGDTEDGGQALGTIMIDDESALEKHGCVGLIMQDPESQIVFARVIDNATFGGENLGVDRKEILSRTHNALSTVHLDKDCGIEPDHLAQELSGGQIQRLSIASIMVMQPDVIICDEPTANLDPEGVKDVVVAIGQIAEEIGATLIVVDHNDTVWEPIIDRKVILDAGYENNDFKEQIAKLREEIKIPEYERSSSKSIQAMRAHALQCGFEGQNVGHEFTGEFNTHEITAITGVNGAGKTTLAMTLAGLLPAISGDVSVSEDIRADIASCDPHEWESRELAPRIQFVFQNPEHQFVTNSVLLEMISALRISHPQLDEKGLRSLAINRLAYYELELQSNQNPYTLSGGQKRRLTVACAIEANPRILIVDEPTYGQDPITWMALVKMFAQLRDSGTCIITVTHDRDFIEMLGAREIELSPLEISHASVKDGDDDIHVFAKSSQSHFVSSLNPITRLGIGIIIGLPLIVSLDIISASVALGLEFVIAMVLGFSLKTLARYTWPVLIGAAGSFITVMMYNAQHSWILALATAIRVIAMGAPAIVMVMRIDPTDLADAFVQKLHISDRFVYAALAGFRLLPFLRVDLESIHQARAIRAIQSRSRLKKLRDDAVSLLVLAIRRSTTLSIVMQARGFGSQVTRTHIRISRTHLRDWCALAVAIAVPVIALGVAYYGGTLNLFGNLV
ncbi:ATP-binding cassette domain-containing protein [Alloscardovia theropitheci]|uniref:ATP-binding cassette domain-containing protein n=1 Tax=Alloscardovia theropitheci TaxID=2496842 RepID=A0A4R0QYM4_9BIFI|nr:ATP-binding cassette domain-containing protein [Alloscardovia theropitheci]TCD53586.1 ATP-binding cassette domain-containing protein [Alloscardovia theropitheci]